MQKKNVIIAVAALAVGVAVGWFARGVGGTGTGLPAEALAKAGERVTGKGERKEGASVAAKPKRKVPIRSAESEWAPPVEQPVEKPKENVVDKAADNGANPDNPFPRYLDMFKNNPEALAAEFEKEAEADRAAQRQLRDWAIDELKLNAEQAAILEKFLDDVKGVVLQERQEEVDLIKSGQLNEEDAADGSIWTSNRLLMEQCVSDRKKAVFDAAVELYNQLDINGVPDSKRQQVIFWATYKTSFSYDSFEPFLQVYDKVYKNMGFGNGIFSWNARQRQLQKK